MRAPRNGDFAKPRTVTLGGDVEPTPTEVAAAADGEAANATIVAEGGKAAPVDAADELILEAAREAALKFTATLPDFVAQQSTERSFAPRAGGGWQPLDVVTAEVVYSRGRDQYKNVMIDGRLTTQPIEKTGAWSTGDFGQALEGVMSEDSRAKFTRRAGGLKKAGGRSAWVFDFSVTAAHSQWVMVAPDGREHKAAHTGSVWIDQETRRVIRIERHAVALPADFPLAKAESIVNYAFVRIDKANALLPAGGETISCVTGGSCSRNVITFSAYRKFGADSSITF